VPSDLYCSSLEPSFQAMFQLCSCLSFVFVMNHLNDMQKPPVAPVNGLMCPMEL
jgi:hypothetical protein